MSELSIQRVNRGHFLMFEHETNVSHGSCEVNPGTVTRRIDSKIVRWRAEKCKTEKFV